MSDLSSLGFSGSLEFVHHEEGSGAKAYRSSAYFPDNRKTPKTKSGITIDPGLDLGNTSPQLIKEVLECLNNEGLLTVKQYTLLIEAIGLKKMDAIKWLERNESYFKNKFLVSDKAALYILENYTADDYWLPLVKGIPPLKGIRQPYLAKAVHTALLSLSYNRGYGAVIQACRKHVELFDWPGLSYTISRMNLNNESLHGRRLREAALIMNAYKQKEKAVIELCKDLNPEPMPLMGIPAEDKQILFNMQYVAVPEKPEVKL